jgi:mannose-1-phosphate guanylyltransferase
MDSIVAQALHRVSGVDRRPASPHAWDHLWAVVLAGALESGRRGSRPGAPGPVRFRQALERAARLVPAERLVAVLARDRPLTDRLAPGASFGFQRLVQPAWRGSAAATFLPVLRIAAADPEAIVAVFPGAQPLAGEGSFAGHVARAVDAVSARPDLPVVIGTVARAADVNGPWIEPGPLIEGLEPWAIRGVLRFRPRPSVEGLVNTRVVVANARTLIGLGLRYLPDVLEAFEPLRAAFGTPEEPLLCEALWEAMPWASIAHALFVRAGEVAVLPVTDMHADRDRTVRGARMPGHLRLRRAGAPR